jgi:hypothetical protein
LTRARLSIQKKRAYNLLTCGLAPLTRALHWSADEHLDPLERDAHRRVPAAIANRGGFSISWDEFGHCTQLVLANSSAAGY